MSNINLNREAYLEKAKDIVLPILESKGFKLPEGKRDIALSVGFSRSRKAVGSWNANYDKEGKFIDHQIFINPNIYDSIEVIDNLIHELCHTIKI